MRSMKKHNSNEDSFWLSATDMMAGLLTIILLLLMLFVLYLNQSKDETYTPLDATQYTAHHEGATRVKEHETSATQHYNRENETIESGEHETRGPEIPTETPTERTSGGFGERRIDKAAVLVTVVDADTGNLIKKEGIEFELYYQKNGVKGLEILYSYYPQKVEHRRFETSDQGSFFLPEKIELGWYSLHNTEPPAGYTCEGDVLFEIDEPEDWVEPVIVTVPMKPIKKNVRIYAEDADSMNPMEHVAFNVIAAEKIMSADGTVRYANGEVVDMITTDETGFAESKELYMGNYYIKQVTTPEFYSVDNSKLISVAVTDSVEGNTGLVKVKCQKTSVTVTLTDERTNAPIEGAVYSMEGGEDYVTDKFGKIRITDLKKMTGYRLMLTSLPRGYKKEASEITFKVNEDGLIRQNALYMIEDTAYTISLRVDVEDYIFGREAKGVDLTLLDEDGKVVDDWTTNEKVYIVSGLDEGKYYVERTGNERSRISVYLQNTPEVQTAEMRVWDNIDTFVILIAVGVVIIAVLITALTVKRKKKVRKKHE